MKRTVCRTTGFARWWAGVALVAMAAMVPQAAQADWFWESWFRPATPVVGPSGNGLVVYNNAPRSWAHLPAIVYASVPTVDDRYPVYSQQVAAGMPVQTAPVRPVVVQTRPAGVYSGGGE
ncbi:MAG: hypothetical protein H7838_05845 [Magnetococcus sp. DMHC-8]